jgi:putative acetyltransferase
MNISIRSENENDYRTVEELTREAFWNLYVQGCNEHYLVHSMRSHPDFIPALDFVACVDDKIVGNIMYTKSHLIDEANNRIDTITFGPISVLPEYQRKGVGTALIDHSRKIAIQMNCKAIIILGHPHNYCKHGFKSAKDWNIGTADGKYPYGHLVLELENNFIRQSSWKCHMSAVFNIDETAADEFDQQFPFKPKEYRYSQYLFSLSCRAYIE